MQNSQGKPSGLFFRPSWFRLLAGRADFHHGLRASSIFAEEVYIYATWMIVSLSARSPMIQYFWPAWMIWITI
jgi:hypothetical protein